MIIGLLNQKGGVGKTTLSLSIAHYLAKLNNKVLVVDADPQQSSLTWLEVREKSPPFNLIGFSKKSLHRDLASIAANYDYTIIDGPPRATDLARSCIMASDLVIIPCTPSPYDVWASQETVDLVKEAMIYKPELKSIFIINRKITNTAIGRDVTDILKDFGFPVMTSAITQRIIFAETAATGLTIFDMDYEGKAAFEVINLVNEILRFSGEILCEMN